MGKDGDGGGNSYDVGHVVNGADFNFDIVVGEAPVLFYGEGGLLASECCVGVFFRGPRWEFLVGDHGVVSFDDSLAG